MHAKHPVTAPMMEDHPSPAEFSIHAFGPSKRPAPIRRSLSTDCINGQTRSRCCEVSTMEGQQNTPRTFHLRKRSNETMSNLERSIARPAENNLQKIPKMHARQTRADLPQVLFSNALVGGDAQRHSSSCPVFPVRRHMSAKDVEILVHTPFPHGWRVWLVCDVGAGSPANFDGVFSYLFAAEAPFRAQTADASSCRFTQSRWTWTESASRGCVPTVFGKKIVNRGYGIGVGQRFSFERDDLCFPARSNTCSRFIRVGRRWHHWRYMLDHSSHSPHRLTTG